MLLKNISRAGILSAITLIILYAASIIPGLKLTLLAISGASLVFAYSKSGLSLTIYVYVISSILAILLLPLKSIALVYIFIFGIYSPFKFWLESTNIKSKMIIKFIFINITLSIFATLIFLILDIRIPPLLVIFSYIVYNVVFVFYDKAMSELLDRTNNRI